MKQIITNGVILVGTYLVPLFVLKLNENNYSNVETIQKVLFTVFFLGAVLLAYLNHRNRKEIGHSKWLWITFEIVGILGIIYSTIILYLIFAFRHGISF